MQHEGNTTEIVLRRLHEAAHDLGRLRNHLNPEPDSHTEWRINQLASHLEALIGMHEPTAADLVAWTYPDDHETALLALEHVDRRHDRLRRTLGHTKAAA